MSLRSRTRPAPGFIVAGVFVIAVLLVLAAAVLTGTDLRRAGQAAIDSLFPPAAATRQGQEIRDLYNVVFFFAAAIFIAVEALIIWTVIRYRRKEGDDELPAQTHGNNLAETLWTVIPTVIVAFLFYISWQTLNSVEAYSERPALQVRATAGQFQWTFDYLAEDGQTVEFQQFQPLASGDTGGMAVPVGVPVRVHLVSPDVIHAFYVPQFLYKKDVVPGKEDQFFEFQLKEEEAGQTFRGQCAELCGAGHRIMVFDVVAMAQTDFDAWLERGRQAGGGPAGPGESVPPDATTIDIAAQNVEFDKKQLEAPADQPFAIRFENREAVPHDVDIRRDGEVIADNQPIGEPSEVTYAVDALPAGEYEFYCSIHPIPAMTGTLTVR